MMHYHAGWSLPGCLPEMDPGIFEDEATANAFIEWEQERFVDDGEDPYVYWVEPCTEDDCAPGLT